MGSAGLALAVAFTAALASLFLALLAAVILRHCWWRRDAGGGFVLFDVCFHDNTRQRAVRPALSTERSRARREREQAPGGEGASAAAADEQEPDECEIARWKIFGGPNRSLSTIDEGTEKGGTTGGTTPAFCTPAGSPDRRDARARTLDMATIAARLQA